VNYRHGRRIIFSEVATQSILKAIKKRKLLPTDDSSKKVIYLAIEAVSKKWAMPIRGLKSALNRFMIEVEDLLRELYLKPAVSQNYLQGLFYISPFYISGY